MDEEIFLVFIIIAVIASLVVAIFYLMTLQNVMKEVSVHNRATAPENVWLMLIPIFNYIYGFILYPKISDSIKNEMEERGIPENGDYARSLGLTMPILNLVGFVPVLGGLAGLANLVILIVYWVKMGAYKTTLQMNPAMSTMTSSSDLLDR